MVVTGWSQDEAAQVVGGMVANLTIVLYAVKWKAPPPMELAPQIAGNPKAEFPLLGAGLAPILDFVAPKGSAAAVGVSLTAGVGELLAAVARRSAVLQVAPKDKPRPAAGGAPEAATAPAPAPSSGNGFRYSGDALRVLQGGDDPYAQMGMG
jgi:hypothetical protein